MIGLLVVLLCLGLLLWLPLRVVIDTGQQLYRFSWQGIFSVWGIPEAEQWRWFFHLFFWEWEWKPGKSAPKPEKKPARKPSKTGAKRSMSFSIRKVPAIAQQVLRAVRLERFRINWDTGDFVLNAWLYPAFQLASRGPRQLSINFMGEQELSICLQSRLGALALAGVRVFLILKR